MAVYSFHREIWAVRLIVLVRKTEKNEKLAKVVELFRSRSHEV